MNFKNKTLIAALLVILFSGCATKYRPMKKPDGVGYSDEKINNQVYKISFRANDRTTDQQLNHYFLRRASEIAIELHRPFFTIIEKEITSQFPRERTGLIPETKARVAVIPTPNLPYSSSEFKTVPMHIIEGQIQLFIEAEAPPNAISAESILKEVKR